MDDLAADDERLVAMAIDFLGRRIRMDDLTDDERLVAKAIDEFKLNYIGSREEDENHAAESSFDESWWSEMGRDQYAGHMAHFVNAARILTNNPSLRIPEMGVSFMRFWYWTAMRKMFEVTT